MGKLERCAKHASLHLPQAALRCACPGPAGPPPYGGSKPQASPSSPTPRKSWREAVSVPRSPFTSIGNASVKGLPQRRPRKERSMVPSPHRGRRRSRGGTAMGGGWDSIKIKNRAASGKEKPPLPSGKRNSQRPRAPPGQRRRPRPVDETGSRRWRSAPIFTRARRRPQGKLVKRKRNAVCFLQGRSCGPLQKQGTATRRVQI